MKKLFSILAVLLISGIVAQAQTVTINTTGNRNKQVVVDGKNYTISNTSASDEQTITINDLGVGQHSLELIRNSQYGSRSSTKTSFTVRTGYDLTVTISSNGSVSTAETRIAGAGTNAGRPISTAAFNRLYSQTKAKTSSSARTTFLENEFANTNRRFTANQASRLISLVNSESMRLKLAKLSYPRISDRQNFNLVSNLLNSSSNRTELSNYIATLDLDDDNLGASDIGVPMDNDRFRTIYNEAYAENASGDRYYYLSNFFSKDFNFYTSSQASQLIQLTQSEEERFNLAKAAYRGVTDRENYGLVSQLLSSYANRTALAAYINSYNSNTGTTGTAMSTANFNSLYNTAYYQSSSVRYSTIYSAFTTAGNYFTVAQAKKLIPLVSDENSRLLLAKTVYSRLTDRQNYAQFNEFLISSSSRTDLYNYVQNYNNSGNVGVGMSEVNYNRLYQDVANSWNQTTRVSIEAEAFRNTSNYFTVDQVRRLLLLISSESDRLSLAKSAFDNTVDQNNYSQLYDLFSTTSYRNDLANFVTGNGGIGTGVYVAMSETEYNNMYKSVQMTFGLGAKMSSLTDIFNTATNFFTAEQAKELVRLVSSETNRLQLAKLSYNNVVDPNNFGVMYDVFTSESAKAELRSFVSTNPAIGQ